MAVAVLAVVLFHAEVPGVGGGFVGVDVFFVISGYLITKIIVRQQLAQALNAGRPDAVAECLPIQGWGSGNVLGHRDEGRDVVGVHEGGSRERPEEAHLQNPNPRAFSHQSPAGPMRRPMPPTVTIWSR